MITNDILRTVKKSWRDNNLGYSISFNNSLDCSRFELALHEALDKAMAEAAPVCDATLGQGE